MSFLRFHHVFAILMLLSVLSAFVLPARFNHRVSDPARANLQGLFAPVSHPARAVASWFHDRFAARESRDPRSSQAVADENQKLKVEVANLLGQLQALQRVNADRDRVGPIRPFCTPVPVIGTDPGNRDALNLGGATLGQIAEGQAVAYDLGVVGRVERRGLLGAQVRLITDVGFRVTGKFGKFEQTPRGEVVFTPINSPAPLVEGAGRGLMVVRNLSVADIKKAELQPEEWVVLDDPDWPNLLQNRRIGRIVSAGPQRNHPLHGEIVVQPYSDLLKLREVMVVTKE
jgi:hypothetical protein